MKKIVYFMALFFGIIILSMPLSVKAANTVEVKSFDELKTELAKDTTSTIKLVNQGASADNFKTTSLNQYLDVYGTHTLDLNGHSIKKFVNASESEFIRVYGTLTVKDTDPTTHGYIIFDSEFKDWDYSSVIKVKTGGKLVIEGGDADVFVQTMLDKHYYHGRILKCTAVYAEENSTVTINGGKFEGINTSDNQYTIVYGEKDSDITIGSGIFHGKLELYGKLYIKSLELFFTGSSSNGQKIATLIASSGINIWTAGYIDGNAKIYEDGVLVDRNPTNGMNHAGDANDLKYGIVSDHIEIKNVIPIDRVELNYNTKHWDTLWKPDGLPTVDNNSNGYVISETKFCDLQTGQYFQHEASLVAGHKVQPTITLKANPNYNFGASNVKVIVNKGNNEWTYFTGVVSDNGQTLVVRLTPFLVSLYGIKTNTDETPLFLTHKDDEKYYLSNKSFVVYDDCHPYEQAPYYYFWYKNEYGQFKSKYSVNSQVNIRGTGVFDCWFEAVYPSGHSETIRKESKHFQLTIKKPFSFIGDESQTINVHKNQSVKLMANATGSNLTYEWKKDDGTAIPDGGHPTYIEVSFSESGEYIHTCAVKDIEGITITHTYKVVVDDKDGWDSVNYCGALANCSLNGYSEKEHDHAVRYYEISMAPGESIDFELLYNFIDNPNQTGKTSVIGDIEFEWYTVTNGYVDTPSLSTESKCTYNAPSNPGTYYLNGKVFNCITFTDDTPNRARYGYTCSITIKVEDKALYNVNVDSSITNGSVTVDKSTAHEGDTVAITPSPASGYSIERVWVTASDDGSEIPVTSDNKFVMPKGSVIVHATYKVTNVTLSYDMNGHGTSISSQTIANGSIPTMPSNPTEKGYEFLGWYTEAACTNLFDFSKSMTNNTTVYAKWEAVECIHINTEVKNVKNATCTSEGYSGDTYCTECNKLIYAGSKLPMKSHTIVDGKCTVCGYKKSGGDPAPGPNPDPDGNKGGNNNGNNGGSNGGNNNNGNNNGKNNTDGKDGRNILNKITDKILGNDKQDTTESIDSVDNSKDSDNKDKKDSKDSKDKDNSSNDTSVSDNEKGEKSDGSGAVEGNTPDGDIEPPVSEPDSKTNVGLVIGLIVAGGAVVLGGGAFGLTMLFKKK